MNIPERHSPIPERSEGLLTWRHAKGSKSVTSSEPGLGELAGDHCEASAEIAGGQQARNNSWRSRQTSAS